MILKKLIIKNIRSHEDYTFEPEESGITAISGTNGTGKSTIVNSFAWSLFGSKAQGFKIKDYIKEGVDPKTTFVGVYSYIIVGNREYEIKRQILASGGSTICHVSSRELGTEDDFVLDCGPAPSHTEKFLKGILGFDEKGFYSSAFVQQKQVDQIILAGPKERSQIIEKMIGVSSITEAIKSAREESRALQKALSIIQVGSIEDIQKQVDTQKAKVINLNSKLSNLQKELNTVVEEFNNINNNYLQEREKQEKFRTLTQQVNLKENDLKNLTERLENQLKIFNSYNTNITYSEDLFNQLSNEYNTKNKEFLEETSKLAIIEKEIQEYEKLFSIDLPKNLIDTYKKVSSNQTRLQELELQYKNQLITLQKEIKQAKSFLIELDNGIAQCPYCRSKIINIEEEKRIHKENLNKLEEDLVYYESQVKKVSEDLSITINKVIELQGQMDILAKQKEVEKELVVKKNARANLKNKLEIDNKTLQIVKKKLDEILFVKNQMNAILTTKATIDLLQKRVNEAKQEHLELLVEQTKLTALDSKLFSKLEKEYLSLQQSKQKLETELIVASKDIEIAKAEGRVFVQQLNSAKKATEDYTKMSNQLNIVNLSIKSLSEFKELRVTTSIPSLSEIASGILEKFTDGEFTEFILNEKFEASVRTSDGKVRGISVLSGGELSAAAIALRLAIALFLNEGQQSILILDEILVSMDEIRQQLILDTIANLNNSQVILIAHSQVANSMADKVIQL